jgi:hypothetical protein
MKIPITLKAKNTFLKTFSFNNNLNKVIDRVNNVNT